MIQAPSMLVLRISTLSVCCPIGLLRRSRFRVRSGLYMEDLLSHAHRIEVRFEDAGSMVSQCISLLFSHEGPTVAVVPARTRIEPLYKHLRSRPLVRTLVVASTVLAVGFQASSAL